MNKYNFRFVFKFSVVLVKVLVCVQKTPEEQQKAQQQLQIEEVAKVLIDGNSNTLQTLIESYKQMFEGFKYKEVKEETTDKFSQLKQRYDTCKQQIQKLQTIDGKLLEKKVENEQKLQNVSSLLQNVQERQKMIERAIIGKMNCNISGIDCAKYNQVQMQFQNAQQVLTCSGQNLDQLIEELTNLVAKFQQKIERI